MAYKDLIQNLSKEIQIFQKMGGNIYSHAKSLPFYERMRSAGKSYQRETGEKISTDQIYAECGIKFNKDYYVFSQFVNKLENIADENGYVDVIKTNKATAEQIEEAQKNYKKQINAMKEYILSRTEMDEKTFNKNKSKDWYLTVDELEKFKVATIIDSFDFIV